MKKLLYILLIISFSCVSESGNKENIFSVDLEELIRIDKSIKEFNFIEDSIYHFKVLQAGCSDCYIELDSFKENYYKDSPIEFFILKDDSFIDVDFMINETLKFEFPVFLISVSDHPEINIGEYFGKVNGNRMIMIEN